MTAGTRGAPPRNIVRPAVPLRLRKPLLRDPSVTRTVSGHGFDGPSRPTLTTVDLLPSIVASLHLSEAGSVAALLPRPLAAPAAPLSACAFRLRLCVSSSLVAASPPLLRLLAAPVLVPEVLLVLLPPPLPQPLPLPLPLPQPLSLPLSSASPASSAVLAITAAAATAAPRLALTGRCPLPAAAGGRDRWGAEWAAALPLLASPATCVGGGRAFVAPLVSAGGCLCPLL